MGAAPKHPSERRRRNVQGVKPDHHVPITGRVGPTPRAPIPLGKSGRQFWRWAWATPQATTWHGGFLLPLARLAALHDEYDDPELESSRNQVGIRMERGYIEFGLTPRAMSSLHLFVTDDDAKLTDPVEGHAEVIENTELAMRRRLKETRTG